MSFFLVRHGLTEANIKKVFYGSTDIGLTEIGIAQARQIGLLLKNVEFESIWCSELWRAQQTAELISLIQSPARSQELQIDGRLNEMDFGEWEMRHYLEIAQQDPQGWQRWMTDWQQAGPTGGEPFQNFAQRVREYAEQLQTTMTTGHQLIVAHQGVLSLILSRLLNMPAAAMWHFTFQHDAYSVVENNAGFMVLRVLNGQVRYEVDDKLK